MEIGSFCGIKSKRLSLSRPYPFIKTLLIIFLLFLFSLSSYPLYSEQFVQPVVKSSSDLIKHYGKNKIISKIMHLRRSRISIEVKGTIRDYLGLPSPAYISPGSILSDIQKLGMSLEQFANLLHKDNLARLETMRAAEAEAEKKLPSGIEAKRAEPKHRSQNVSPKEIAVVSLDKLMALSGLNKQIAEFPGMVRAGVEQARQKGSRISNAEFEEVQRSIERAYQSSEILNTIGKEIKNNISESETKDLLAWFESNLGRRITKAEEKASTPAAYQEMIREAQSLLADEMRVKFANKIDSLVNATEMTLQLQENSGVAVFTAISSVMNPGQSVNIDAFKAQMSAQEQQMRANIEQFVILSLVYSYKDIDLASIEKYVKYLERPNTRKFNDSVIKGMKYSLNQSIDKMAKSLAVVFKKYNEKVAK